jgi:hypothetical protein
MTSDEYKKQISNEIKRFIKKRVEVRKIYKELQQVKDNIIYLKKKYGKEITEEFQTDEGNLKISKYKSEFSSRLKKEFKDLPIEKKRELYKSGLLTILFRLNYSKYEKLRKENKTTPIDEYAIKRDDIQPYTWTVQLTEKSQNELNEFEKDLKERFDIKLSDQEDEVQKQLNEIEKDREKISYDIQNDQALIKEQLEEMEIGYEALNFDGSIPDVYEALMNDLVEIEENEDDE